MAGSLKARLREAELIVQLRLLKRCARSIWNGVERSGRPALGFDQGDSGGGNAGRVGVAEGITLEALRRLRAALLESGNTGAIAARWQLEPARARVFTGGLRGAARGCARR